MRTEHSVIKHDMEVNEPFTMHGIVSGNVVVNPTGLFILHGIMSGTLTVKERGTAIIHGIVQEDAINHGGHLSVRGFITGTFTEEGGFTDIITGAIINGVRH